MAPLDLTIISGAIRGKFDVGNHPGLIGKSKVGTGATIRGHPRIHKYYGGTGQQVLDYYWPTDPKTQAQLTRRAIFADAVAAWQALTDEERAAWRTKATRRSKLGYSMFLTHYLKNH